MVKFFAASRRAGHSLAMDQTRNDASETSPFFYLRLLRRWEKSIFSGWCRKYRVLSSSFVA
jgi:hypothetical protein